MSSKIEAQTELLIAHAFIPPFKFRAFISCSTRTLCSADSSPSAHPLLTRDFLYHNATLDHRRGGGRGRGGKGARRGKTEGGARGRRGSARGEAVGGVVEGTGAWWAIGGGAEGGYVGAGGLAAGGTRWGVEGATEVGANVSGAAVAAWEGGGTGGGVGAVGGGGEAANAAEGWTGCQTIFF
ncbi:unnamed protein product [Closterium sp. Naga37s-1]|nr:unnamed protein product [Closterium sp. Naga37s-1]